MQLWLANSKAENKARYEVKFNTGRKVIVESYRLARNLWEAERARKKSCSLTRIS